MVKSLKFKNSLMLGVLVFTIFSISISGSMGTAHAAPGIISAGSTSPTTYQIVFDEAVTTDGGGAPPVGDWSVQIDIGPDVFATPISITDIGSTPGTTIVLTMDPSDTINVAIAPKVIYTSSGGAGQIESNVDQVDIANIDTTGSDGIIPFIVSAERTELNTIVLEYSENVGGTDISNSYTVAGSGAVSNVAPGNTFVTLTTTGLAETFGTPLVTYDADVGNIADASGNEAADGENITADDKIPPVMLSGNTGPGADEITYTFSEAIDTTGSVENTDFSPAVGFTVAVIDTTVSGNTVIVQFASDFTPGFTEGILERFTGGSSINDVNGNSLTQGLGLPAVAIGDGFPSFTAEHLTTTTTEVTFNTPIDGTWQLADWTVGGGAVTAMVDNNGQIQGQAIVVSATSVILTHATIASDATLVVEYLSGDLADISDADPLDDNTTATASDEIIPAMNSAQTKTTTTIEVTFSEDLDGGTVEGSDFTLSAGSISSASETSPGVVTIITDAAFGTGETPNVSLTNDVNDVNGNTLGTAGPVTTTDGVAPILLTAVTGFGTNQITYTFSEDVTGLEVGDFAAVNGFGTLGATLVGSDGIRVNFSDDFETGFEEGSAERFSGGGSVADSSGNTLSFGEAGSSVAITDGLAPVITTNSPLTTEFVNDADEVNFSLSETVTSGTITFTPTSGDAVTHTYTLTGGQLTNGPHPITIATLNADVAGFASVSTLVEDAVYDITIEATDADANVATPDVTVNITYDNTVPVFSSLLPTSSSIQNNDGTVGYTLSEVISSGTITFTGTSGPDDTNVHIYDLSLLELDSGPTTITFADIQSGLNVLLPDDGSEYTIAFAGTDAAGNDAIIQSVTSILYDNTLPVFSSVTPLTGTSNNADAEVGFTNSEFLVSGTLTFEQTGGAADGDSPHEYTFSIGDLQQGPQTITFADIDAQVGVDLKDGSIYTIKYDGVDAAGNVASTVETELITFDITDPVITPISPTDSTKVGSSHSVEFSLDENVASGTIEYTRSSGPADAASHIYNFVGADLNIGGHDISLATLLTDGDFNALVNDVVYDIKIVATDDAGNKSLTSTITSLTFDETSPTFTAIHRSPTLTEIIFSEPVSGTWNIANWDVPGAVISSLEDNNTIGDGGTAVLATSVELTHSIIPGDSTITVTYSIGEMTDEALNALPDATNDVAEDDIAPELLSAITTTENQITYTFSEPMGTSGTEDFASINTFSPINVLVTDEKIAVNYGGTFETGFAETNIQIFAVSAEIEDLATTPNIIAEGAGTFVDIADGLAPVLVSGTTGPGADQVTYTFSEPMDTTGSVREFDFLDVNGKTPNTATVDGSDVILTFNGNIDTDFADAVENNRFAVGGLVFDVAFNTLQQGAGDTFTAITDGIAPTLDSVVTGPELDELTFTFSENFNPSSVLAGDFATVASNNVESITSKVDNVAVVNFGSDFAPGFTDPDNERFTELAEVFDLAPTPNSLLQGTGDTTIPVTDGIAPTMDSAVTTSANTIEVTFSEDLNGNTIQNTDFTVSDNTVTNAVENEDDGVVTLTLQNTIGTGVTPDVTLGGDGLNDANNVSLASAGPITPTDGIAPTWSAKTTTLTTTTVTFSEGMENGVFASGDWEVDGETATGISPSGAATGETTVVLTHAPLVDGASVPTVTYTPGNLEDQGDNALVVINTGVTDGIAPVLLSVETGPPNNILTYTFSEDVEIDPPVASFAAVNGFPAIGFTDTIGSVVTVSFDGAFDSDYTDTNAIERLAGSGVLDLNGNAVTSGLVAITDSIDPVITTTSPLGGGFVNDDDTVDYNLSETVDSGTITFTQTGGPDDTNDPHTYTFSGLNGDLDSGDHSILISTLQGGFSLVDGATYTIDIDATDLSANDADTSTITLVTYDITAPVITPISPTDSTKVGSSHSVEFSLDETVASGTIQYTRVSGPADAGLHVYHFAVGDLTTGPHDISLATLLTDGDFDALVNDVVYDIEIVATDDTGNTSLPSTITSLTFDNAPPTFTAVHTTTTTTVVTFTEPVSGTWELADWAVNGFGIDSMEDNNEQIETQTATDATSLTLTHTAISTDSKEFVTYFSGDIADSAANQMDDTTVDAADDGIAPTFTAVSVSDTQTRVDFSEPVDGTLDLSKWITGASPNSAVASPSGAVGGETLVDDTSILFTHFTTTDQTPGIQYLPGDIVDNSALTPIALVGVTFDADDGIAPTWSAVHDSLTQTTVTFSEPITGTLELGDWDFDGNEPTSESEVGEGAQLSGAQTLIFTHPEFNHTYTEDASFTDAISLDVEDAAGNSLIAVPILVDEEIAPTWEAVHDTLTQTTVTFSEPMSGVLELEDWSFDDNEPTSESQVSNGNTMSSATTLIFTHAELSTTGTKSAIFEDVLTTNMADNDDTPTALTVLAEKVTEEIAPTFTADRTELNTIILSFSEPINVLTNPDPNSFTITSPAATASASKTGPSEITLATTGLTATDGTPQVDYDAGNGDVTDDSGNAPADGGAILASDSVTPTFTAERTGINEITLEFSELISTPGGTDAFTVVDGGTVTHPLIPGATTTLVLTTNDFGSTDTSQTPLVTYNAGVAAVTDSGTNEVADGEDAVASDGVAPALISVVTGPIANTISYTFSEFVFDVDNTDFVVVGGNSIIDNSGGGASLVIITYDSDFDSNFVDTNVIERLAGSLLDGEGNAVSSASAAITDGLAPNIVSAVTGPLNTQVTYTFDEAMSDAGGIEAGDFAAVDGNNPIGTPTVSGNDVTVTFDDTFDTILTVSLAERMTGPGSIQDVALNPLSSFSVAIDDGLAATLVSAQTGPASNVITYTFSEPIDSDSVASGDFANVDGDEDPISVIVVGSTATVTFESPDFVSNFTEELGERLTNDGEIDDLAVPPNTTISGTGNTSVEITDGIAPILVSAETGPELDEITYTFDEDIDISTVQSTDFLHVFGNFPDDITTDADGTEIIVSFTNNFETDLDDVGVNERLDGDIEDIAGNTQSTGEVAIDDGLAPTFTAETTSLTTTTITFNEPLNDGTFSDADWTVDGNASTIDLDGQSASDTSTALLTHAALTNTGSLPVIAYTPGTLKDQAGNPLDGTSTGITDGITPIVTITLPLTATSVNGASVVDFNLSEDVDSGSISFTRFGGEEDSQGIHIYTLTGTELNEGDHSFTLDILNADEDFAETNPLQTGVVYDITIQATDDGTNLGFSQVAAVTYDDTATNFSGVTPAPSSFNNDADTVGYSIDDKLVTGTITFTGTSGSDNGGIHVYNLLGDELSDASTTITFAQINDRLTVDLVSNTVYTIEYDGEDEVGNPSPTVTTLLVTYDTTLPTMTPVGPPQDSNNNNLDEITFTNSEALSSGTITFLGTGGTDGGATHTYTLDAGELADTSAQSITFQAISAAADTSLVNGGIYSIIYDATDLAGNDAITVTTTGVTYDTSAPSIGPVTITSDNTFDPLWATNDDTLTLSITGDQVLTIIDNPIINGLPATIVTNDATTVVLTRTVVAGEDSDTHLVAFSVYVEDPSGNSIEVFSITEGSNLGIDTTAPTFTLTPSGINEGGAFDTAIVKAVDTYTANTFDTTSDNTSGVLSEVVDGDTAVDETFTGEYIVTYTVTDRAGNTSVATETVTVGDGGGVPVITLTGEEVIEIINNVDTYEELGATVLDDEDGADVATVGGNTVDETTNGEYTVTYDFIDSSGNAAEQVTRTVNVVPGGIPIITLTGANPQTIEINTPYVELDATASDVEDGNISDDIVITGDTFDTSVADSYQVTYDVTDSSGNPAEQVTRTVNVVNPALPIITILGNNPETIPLDSEYNDAGARAIDVEDGDISTNIVTVNNVEADTVGEYTVTYNVVDSDSNPANQAVRTVNVVAGNAPVITLNGAASVQIRLGSSYADPGASCEDPEEGELPVFTTGSINTGLRGAQILTFTCTDDSGLSSQTSRTVTVLGGGGGGNDRAKTAPTSGDDWNTHKLIVEGGIVANGVTYDIEDNWHTDFDLQETGTGEPNTFSTKVWAQNGGLFIHEIAFGVPEVGKYDESEAVIEVWYNYDKTIDEVIVVQETEVVEVTSLNVTTSQVECRAGNDAMCYQTNFDVIFREPLQSNVFAVKSIDMTRRSMMPTYLNDGLIVNGESLNPMKTMKIGGPEKYEGVIIITQSEKYSDLWFSADGRIFEVFGESDSVRLVPQETLQRIDTGSVDKRTHSAYADYKVALAEEYKKIFDSSKIQKLDPESFAHAFPDVDSRTQFLIDNGLMDFIRK